MEALVLPRLAPVPYLLGLGLEGSVRCLKVWRLDAKDKAGGPGPELIRISRYFLYIQSKSLPKAKLVLI